LVLGADCIDAERHHTQVIGEVDAVDDERDKAELIEVPGEQFIKGMLDPPRGPPAASPPHFGSRDAFSYSVSVTCAGVK
jgi:hypothetical protein